MNMRSLFQNMVLKNLRVNWAKARKINLDSFCLQPREIGTGGNSGFGIHLINHHSMFTIRYSLFEIEHEISKPIFEKIKPNFLRQRERK